MPRRHPELPAVEGPEALDQAIATSPAVLLYFSGPDCAVCDALRPRVAELMVRRFPHMRVISVDCATWPALAARHQVFAVPAVLGFFDGREWVRKGRGFALAELEAALARPYDLLLGNTS